MRFRSVITLRRSGVYRRNTRSVFLPFSSTTLKFARYPSSFRIRAISTFSFDEGKSTRGCLARAPFRIRVKRSAMGSVVILSSSPTRLHHAGDFSLEREAAETDAAHFETCSGRRGRGRKSGNGSAGGSCTSASASSSRFDWFVPCSAALLRPLARGKARRASSAARALPRRFGPSS